MLVLKITDLPVCHKKLDTIQTALYALFGVLSCYSAFHA